MGLCSNKNYLVMGVRNRWSLAWGIAKKLHREDARLFFTYQGDQELKRLSRLSETLGCRDILRCDVSRDEDLDGLREYLTSRVGELHGVVHGIAHARRENLEAGLLHTTRDGFLHALNVSAYSLPAVARRLEPLLRAGSSLVSLTYMGSERILPGYDVMGVAKAALEACVRYLAYDLGAGDIRVNAISAGPVRTASTAVLSRFQHLLEGVREKSPLRRGVGLDDIAGTAVYLLSDLASGVTGEVIHVDCGYSRMGV